MNKCQAEAGTNCSRRLVGHSAPEPVEESLLQALRDPRTGVVDSSVRELDFPESDASCECEENLLARSFR